ncbi:MAG: hypothetical protein FH758_01510 [Firmicutes bacterium]|nr:hypothetical protein [Bacillota bacterium]
MDDRWIKIQEIEEIVEIFHTKMVTNFEHLLKGIVEQNNLDFKNVSEENFQTSTMKFYAVREFDSNGKDLHEAYLEVNGDKKYWKKDGEKETIIEPIQKNNKYLENMWQNLLPVKGEGR